ncbi:MAG: hypothetical protein Q8S19_00595, partial [Bacillota bacterium]|nr:hypothetical protein [Bacillota bacterium]
MFEVEVGSWRLEVGGWILEVGSWRLEVGGWRLGEEQRKGAQCNDMKIKDYCKIMELLVNLRALDL